MKRVPACSKVETYLLRCEECGKKHRFPILMLLSHRPDLKLIDYELYLQLIENKQMKVAPGESTEMIA